MTQFVDGAPLDATILSGLEKKIDELNAKTASIGLSNSLVEKKILVGTTDLKQIPIGTLTPIEIIFEEEFSTMPTVVATLYSPSGNLTDDDISISVGNISTKGFTVFAYFKKAVGNPMKGNSKGFSFNWIAITA